MPIYPFLALAIGAKLADVWQHRHVKSTIWVVLFSIIAIAGLGGCVYFTTTEPQPILVVMSVVLAVTMAIVAWLVNQSDRRFIPLLFAGMYAVLFLLMSSQLWIWELNEAFPVKAVAALITQQVPPGTKIYTSFAYNRPSLDFYCDCKVIPTDSVLPQNLLDKSFLLLNNTTLQNLNLPNYQLLGNADEFSLIAPSLNSP